MLRGHRLDAAFAPFEALHDEVEFGLGLLQVGDSVLVRSGLGELLHQTFAFHTALMLADDDARVRRLLACLSAVRDHGVAQFFVRVLQVGDDDDGAIRKQ